MESQYQAGMKRSSGRAEVCSKWESEPRNWFFVLGRCAGKSGHGHMREVRVVLAATNCVLGALYYQQVGG